MNIISKVGLGLLCCAAIARAELTNYTSGVLAGISGIYDSLAAETTNSAPAVCLVDMRHPDTVREAAKKPPTPKVQPYLEKMRSRHAELSGLRCVVIHYTQLKAEDLPRTNIRVLLINALDKELGRNYREQLLRVIRETRLPVFGFCGGHQLIAEAFGGQIAYMRKLRQGEADPRPTYQPGQFKEWGFMPVSIIQRDPLFEGLGDQPVVREMHAWHITKLPAEFTVLAANDECPIEAIKHKQRLMYGTQFHPEQYDDQHLDGRVMLRNFYKLAGLPAPTASYPDRWVWIFGWGLGKDADVAEITQVLENGAAHGINGAVVSFGLDALCKKSPAFFRRLDAVQQACTRLKIELIPSVFSIGYGGGVLGHDRHLAEGLPVVDAPFVAHAGIARFAPAGSARLVNGDCEQFKGNKLKGFNFHDEPGKISFIDTTVKHGGAAALRLENFASDPHGHGRVMQEVRVQPYRCYRLSTWVKTEELKPTHAFMMQVLAGNRNIAPREFGLQPTADWRKLTMVFNSLSNETVRVYAGMWGGKSGKLWLDDWSLEEVGPLNVLHRPGTPVTVRSADGATTFTEGKDYAPLVDEHFNPYRVPEGAGVPLKLLPGSRIAEGQPLKVSWYHSMLIHDSQVSLCMAEPKLYEIFEEEAQQLAQHLKPRRVLLSMDEVRMGGTCAACRGKDMAKLIGDCVSRQAEILRRYIPRVGLLVWSDMFDPHHNAHGNYYLVEGDFTGSWNHIPKDMGIAVWGGEPREKDLKFFADAGFSTVCCCYYDADSLKNVEGWIKLAGQTRGVRGFMYTPWQKKYKLLPTFGDLLLQAHPAGP